MTDKELTLQLLQSKPISYRADFARICESVTAGIMLSQAYYWHGRSTKHGDGWFEKTGAEWEAETALTEKQQQTARHILARLGLMESERKGDRGRMCSRVNFENLHKMLVDYYTIDQQAAQSQIGKTENLDRQNVDSKTGKKGNLSLQRIHTENTAKTKTPNGEQVNLLLTMIYNEINYSLYKDHKLRKIIQKALADHSFEYLKTCLAGYLKDKWANENNYWNFYEFFSSQQQMERYKAKGRALIQNAAESLKKPSEGISQDDQAAFDNLHRLMAEAN